jgi:SAM-dependent methyltransferase
MLDFRPDTFGVDINVRAVEFCRQRGLTAETMEIDQLPFGPGSFDSVLMDNVLEHIVEPAAILSEIRRVLRPNARFLVGVPGRRGWDSDPDHKIRYDDESLVECIERHGFKHCETFHTPLWRSDFLDRKVRQYCIYGAFDRVG